MPKVKPKVDLNGTQVAAHQQLLYLLLQLNRPLCLYQIHHSTSFEVTEEKLKEFGVVEGVLHITQILTTMWQYETLYCAAFGPIIKLMVYNMLTSGKVACVAQKLVTAAPSVIQKDIVVEHTTKVGKDCLDQAILEFKRRFLGNTTESKFEMLHSIVIND